MHSKFIPLSSRTSDLIYTIEQSIREIYISHELRNQEKVWVNSYNNIKGESWPECSSYSDFNSLPDDIKHECIHVHNFSLEQWNNSIVEDADIKFCRIDRCILADWTVKLFEKHPEILQDKKVIDIACNFGYWSAFSYLNQCHSVVGVDVRDDNLKVAKSIQEDLALPTDQVEFVKADIHDYTHIKKLCDEKNTVLLLGIMYHIHDHFNVLQAVCQPTVQHVVIETGQSTEIINSPDPLIWWKTESTFELLAGSMNRNDEILVGYPNTAWFDIAMRNLGFERVSTLHGERYNSAQKIEKFKYTRSVFLYKRLS